MWPKHMIIRQNTNKCKSETKYKLGKIEIDQSFQLNASKAEMIKELIKVVQGP